MDTPLEYHLCAACGGISHGDDWSMLKRQWNLDETDYKLVPIEPGDYDPIMRCPLCQTLHEDPDGPGYWEGTLAGLAEQRSQMVLADDPLVEDWKAVNLEVNTSDFEPLPSAEEIAPTHGWKALRDFIRRDGSLHIDKRPKWRLAFFPSALTKLAQDPAFVRTFADITEGEAEKAVEERRSQIRRVK